LNQTYSKIEYIIIDGKSTDGTLGIISKYKTEVSKLVSERDNGLYDAMNKGLRLATGQIIGIINSDDWYELDAIETIVNTFFEDSYAQVIYGNMNVYDNDKFILTRYPGPLEWLQIWMPIPHPSVFMKGEVYKKYDFRTEYGRAGDRELLLKLYSQNYKFAYLNKTLANYRMPSYDKLGFPLRRAVHNLRISIRYMDDFFDILRVFAVFLLDLAIGIKGMNRVLLFVKKLRRAYGKSQQPL